MSSAKLSSIISLSHTANIHSNNSVPGVEGDPSDYMLYRHFFLSQMNTARVVTPDQQLITNKVTAHDTEPPQIFLCAEIQYVSYFQPCC